MYFAIKWKVHAVRHYFSGAHLSWLPTEKMAFYEAEHPRLTNFLIVSHRTSAAPTYTPLQQDIEHEKRILAHICEG